MMIANEKIPLRVVVPLEVLPSPIGVAVNYTATNIPDTVELWNGASNYAKGARVRSGPFLKGNNFIYEALSAITGPQSNSPPDDPTRWVYVGPTNRQSPFDGVINTRASLSIAAPNRIEYTFVGFGSGISTSQTFDSVAFFGMRRATAITVTVTQSSVEIYNKTISLADNSAVIDAWAYFFGEVETYPSAIFEDVPGQTGNVMQVTIFGIGGWSVQVGEIVIGKSRQIGNLTIGGRVGIEDYSRKERDTFGNFNIIQRAYSDFADFSIVIREDEVSSVRNYLATQRATPCVYHAGREYVPQGLIAYGFFKDLAIEFTSGPIATCTLSIEGLT